jgi:hypothetical protein
MGIFSWLLEHRDEGRDPHPDDELLVPPQLAPVEEAEVVIVPFGSLRALGQWTTEMAAVRQTLTKPRLSNGFGE